METLANAKCRISADYVGRDGIHGVGMRASDDAICIYCSHMSDELRHELEESVAPYQIIMIVESAPRLQQ